MTGATVRVEWIEPIHHNRKDQIAFYAIISVDGHSHQEPATVIAPDYAKAFVGMVDLGRHCQALAAAAGKAAEQAKRSLYIPGRGNGASG